MRKAWGFIVIALVICSCDENRLYEDYKDFEERSWVVTDLPKFEFTIADTQKTYNIYCNLRNSVSYPFSDFRFTYYLKDSVGNTMESKLMIQYLFDRKSGKPFGESGLGDIYDHQFLIRKDYKFKTAGRYSVAFEQFMRTEALEGILAVGLRVERVEKD
jgi:gliding motility-associated lipoprotein GldH